MASNPDFVQYIIDQCSGAGEIAVNSAAAIRWGEGLFLYQRCG